MRTDCFLMQGAAKVLIFPVVQQFTEAFVQALQIPDGPTSDSGFKMEVLKVSADCHGHGGSGKWATSLRFPCATVTLRLFLLTVRQ